MQVIRTFPYTQLDIAEQIERVTQRGDDLYTVDVDGVILVYDITDEVSSN